jgi:hypothetical protein
MNDFHAPDLKFQDQQQAMSLLQALSPQALVGDPRYVKNARPGTFIGRLGDDLVVLVEFIFQAIAFLLTHPEFAPDQKAPVMDHGERLPPEARFHYAHEGYARSGHYLPNGNMVVPTITALMLVILDGRQHASAFRFSHSAFPIGKEFATRAARLKGTAEGETVRVCTAGKYSMTAVRETKNGRTYFVPKSTLLGVVGEPAGPTLAQFRFADELRRAFKQGEDWASLEPPEPPPLLPKAGSASVVIEAEAEEVDETEPPEPQSKRTLADDLNDKVPF